MRFILIYFYTMQSVYFLKNTLFLHTNYSDELYYVTKTATYCLSIPLFVHFSFSPMKISVTDLSAPIGASVLTFCVHL